MLPFAKRGKDVGTDAGRVPQDVVVPKPENCPAEPFQNAISHTVGLVRMAIRMVHITREHALEHKVSMKLRVGVNSGPVVAGVIGKSKYIYDLWGDTVNLASRMESGGLPDTIQVTRPVYEKLKDQFVFEPRGEIEVKGVGKIATWLLKRHV